MFPFFFISPEGHRINTKKVTTIDIPINSVIGYLQVMTSVQLTKLLSARATSSDSTSF